MGSIPAVESGALQAYARSRLTVTLNGKYVLERRLGGGGMAEVFLAQTIGAEGFSRPVAIKRVLDGLSQDPLFAHLFVAEAQLSSLLQHPNLVSVLDFDRDADGRLFLVMELVNGVDLHALLLTGPLPFSVVIHLAIEILRGLDYAHELPINEAGVRGLIHRDISPHNVLLSWEGAVKLADFGIAKARAATNASASVLIKGKPSYMSPEQVNGRPLDGRSDLFAVGVMMFEMLCSIHLFAGSTIEETLGQVLYREIPQVRDMRPDVPEDLSNVVASLLVRDRDHRMPSAEAAIAALVTCEKCPKAGREELIETMSQRFAGRAPMRARNVSHISHSDPTVVARSPPAMVPHARTSTSEHGGPPRRDRRWRWAVLAAFLAVGGVICVLVSGGSGEKPAAIRKPASSEPAALEPPRPGPPDLAATTPATAPKWPKPAPPDRTVPRPGAEPHAAPGTDTTATQPSAKTSGAAPVRDHANGPARRRQNSASQPGGMHEVHL